VETTNEISVVRPDSVVPGSPGRCVQRLKFDATTLGGILGSIAALNTAGLIEKLADGSAQTIPVSTFATQTSLNLKANLASPTFTGTVSGITPAMIGLENVNNTSDANKPISTATQTALDLKANLASPTFTGIPAVPTATAGTNTTQAASTAFVTTGLALKANLASPVFTGTPTVPTATAGTNTTQAASTAFVSTAISNLVNSSPAVLDTLGELASALGNDPNFATSITALIGTKLAIANNLSDLNNRQTALNNLAGAVTSGSFLRGNGVNVTLSAIQASDIPILNQNTTGTSSGVTGIVAIANGGTGSATQNFVDLSTTQTIGGTKTFSNRIYVSDIFMGNPHSNVSTDLGKGYIPAGSDWYEDYKVGASGQIRYRCGAGAEFGYTRQFMQVDANTGNIIFNSSSASTSTTTGAVTATSMGLTGRLSVDNIVCSALPTSASGLPAGSLWRDGNVVKIV